MLIVFGAGGGIPAPRTAAEGMALLSGISWAWAMVSLRRVGRRASEIDKAFVPLLFLGPLFILLTLVPGGRPWTAPSLDALLSSGAWLLAFGLVWMPVVLTLTMFGGSRLDPGRVAVLLMLEVVIGLASAALLTHEPFGGRELAGAVFVLAACATEVLSLRVPADCSPGPSVSSASHRETAGVRVEVAPSGTRSRAQCDSTAGPPATGSSVPE